MPVAAKTFRDFKGKEWDYKTHFLAYQHPWNRQVFNPLTVELWFFYRYLHKLPVMHGLGAPGHYKNICKMIWGPQNKTKQLLSHPWGDRIIDAVCEYDRVALAGCSGSSKSLSCAPWAIINFIADPTKTLIVVCSTTVALAKLRIWGYIRDYWTASPYPLPGKLMDSLSKIVPAEGDKVFSEKTGIILVAAERGQEKEATDKVMGLHAENVILILDELPELSQSIVNTAISNLSQNPYFQLIGLGNPKDYYDAFSSIAKPFGGWQSINVDMDEWRTESGGICLHFDSMKSPNIIEGKTIYPFLPTVERLTAAKINPGENTLNFWRQWRGYWAPEGTDDGIYSQAEIVMYGADKRTVEWHPDIKPVGVAFLDIGLVNGGDKCMVQFGKFGRTKDNEACLFFEDFMHISENVNDTKNPREVQIVMAYRRECEKRGILPQFAGYDASGGGLPFKGFFEALWSKDVMPLQFGGAPSELPVSDTDKTPCKDKYVNMVTEIWFSGKWMIRNGVIRGMSPELIEELCKRKYTTNKGVDLKLQAEPKREMKARIGRSPDLSDSAMGVVTLVRRKFKFSDKSPHLTYGKEMPYFKYFSKKHSIFRPSFDSGYKGLKKTLEVE